MPPKYRYMLAVFALFSTPIGPYSAMAAPRNGEQAQPSQGGFANPDALFAYLKKTDQVLNRVVDQCVNILVRNEKQSPGDGTSMLKVTALCTIRNNPDEDADCPSLQLSGDVSVDRPQQVTLRKALYTKVCSSEGR